MTRHFARPVFVVTLSKHRILVVLRATHSMSLRAHYPLFHSVRSTLSLRAKKQGPRGILCTRGEKEYASIRQAIVACDDRLVKNEAYDARGNLPEG